MLALALVCAVGAPAVASPPLPSPPPAPSATSGPEPTAIWPATPPASPLPTGEPDSAAVWSLEALLARLAPGASGEHDTPAAVPVEVAPPRVERMRFQSGRDRVLAEVFTPAGHGPHPVVALLHGAHPRRSEKHYLELGEDLARRGFLTMFVRVYDRGRKGRGTRADWRRSVSDALTFAASLPTADQERMGVLGFSLGAFLALEQAPRDPRIRAAVAFYGGLSRGLADLALDAMPPVLLLHGTGDRVVPARRSVEVAEELRLAGRQADLIVYPAARHGFCLNSRGGVDREASTDAWSRAVAFLSGHLVGPTESPAATEELRDRPDWLEGASGTLRVLVNPSPEEVKQATTTPPKRQARRAGAIQAPARATTPKAASTPVPR